MKSFISIVAALLIASTAHAADVPEPRAVTPPNPECALKEQVSIGINFNFYAKTLAEAKARFDQKLQEIAGFAKQNNMKRFDLQSMNYNVSAQQSYDGGAPGEVISYQLNGSANYLLDSAENAFRLGEFFAKNRLQFNINSNAYRQGNCGEGNGQ